MVHTLINNLKFTGADLILKSRHLNWVLKTLIAFLTLIPAGMASTSQYYLDSSRLELQVSPTTQTASGMVKVSSNSDKKLRLKVLPKLWKLSPQGTLSYYHPPADTFNLLDHIGINPEEFDLLPGKSRLVRFVVKVPPGNENAEYPFQLYFQPTDLLEPSSRKQTPGVSNILDVVPIFTTTVYVYQGNPTPDVRIKNFQCSYQPNNGAFPVTLDLENAGKRHARLFGNIVITAKNAANNAQPLDVLHMQNSTLIIVFPGSPRTVQNQLTSEKIKTLAAGNYQMELQLVDERNLQPAIQRTCDFSVPGH